MPTITKINVPKKSPRKRAVYLDGGWAFNCLAVVVEKFGLVVGLEISAEVVEKIKGAEVGQKAFDKGLAILSKRLHSVSEMRTKLGKAKYAPDQIEGAITRLTELGYLNDVRFSKTKAHAAAEYKKHGRRRAYVELVKAGVDKETARKASEDVFEGQDSMKVARELAAKKVSALRKYGAMVALRRLMGMLLRRGFTFDEIKPVLDEVLADVGEVVPEGVNPATGEVICEVAEEGAVVDTEEAVKEDVGDWRQGLLAHHQRKKEKPSKGGFGRWKRKSGGR